MNITESDLQDEISREIICLQNIQQRMTMNRRKELLGRHPYKIWQGKNGSFYTYMPDITRKNGKKLIQKNTLEKVEDAIVEYQKQIEDNPTVEEVFNEWNDRKLSLQKISGATHMRNRNFFKRHYDSFGKRRIKTISPDEWCDFIEEQIPRFNLTAKGFAGLKGITRGLLKRAKRRGLIAFSADTLMDNLDVDEADFKRVVREDCEEVFSEEETDKIVGYLLQNMDTLNLCLLLIFVTGMRVGEVTALKHEDIDNQFCYINVRRTESREVQDGVAIEFVKDFPKTEAGVRSVVIPRQWQWLIQKLYDMSAEQSYVFERSENHTRYDGQSVRHRLYRICHQLSIVPKSPHKIRKTYASILLDSGIDQRMILDQMGHSSIGVTERNYHRNRKTIDAKVDALSKIPDLVLENVTNLTSQKVRKMA